MIICGDAFVLFGHAKRLFSSCSAFQLMTRESTFAKLANDNIQRVVAQQDSVELIVFINLSSSTTPTAFFRVSLHEADFLKHCSIPFNYCYPRAYKLKGIRILLPGFIFTDSSTALTSRFDDFLFCSNYLILQTKLCITP